MSLTEALEHIQNIGTGYKVSRKYEIKGGIESLLENFDAEDLFSHIEGKRRMARNEFTNLKYSYIIESVVCILQEKLRNIKLYF